MGRSTGGERKMRPQTGRPSRAAQAPPRTFLENRSARAPFECTIFLGDDAWTGYLSACHHELCARRASRAAAQALVRAAESSCARPGSSRTKSGSSKLQL